MRSEKPSCQNLSLCIPFPNRKIFLHLNKRLLVWGGTIMRSAIPRICDPHPKSTKIRSQNGDILIQDSKSKIPRFKIQKSRSRNQDPEIKVKTDKLNKLYQVSKGKGCFHRPSPYFTGTVRLQIIITETPALKSQL